MGCGFVISHSVRALCVHVWACKCHVHVLMLTWEYGAADVFFRESGMRSRRSSETVVQIYILNANALERYNLPFLEKLDTELHGNMWVKGAYCDVNQILITFITSFQMLLISGDNFRRASISPWMTQCINSQSDATSFTQLVPPESCWIMAATPSAYTDRKWSV